MERFIVSARKYRPDTFETLVGQESIATTLKNSILRNQLAHAYLFCGPRGVGKTSSARIFAKTINCLNPGEGMTPCGECESCVSFAEGRSYSIHELDAASNNSVDDIRQLNELVRIPPQIGKYSVYIIDEVHMLSSSAFNAFLKTLEEPPAHAIFILATTEKHKILPTILSRCQTYDFNRISGEDIVRKLQAIAEKEGIEIEIEALHIIAQKADGAMRDALTIFDQAVAFCGKKIEYQRVISALNVLDYEYYIRLTDLFLQGSYSEALLIFDEVLSKGFNALHFIGGLSTHFRNLLIAKDRTTAKLLELAPSVTERYREQSALCSLGFLYEALSVTTACEAGYKTSGQQRLHIEFALIKLCKIAGGIPESTAVTQATAVSSNKPQQSEASSPTQTSDTQASTTKTASAPIESPQGAEIQTSNAQVSIPNKEIIQATDTEQSTAATTTSQDNTTSDTAANAASTTPQNDTNSEAESSTAPVEQQDKTASDTNDNSLVSNHSLETSIDNSASNDTASPSSVSTPHFAAENVSVENKDIQPTIDNVLRPEGTPTTLSLKELRKSAIASSDTAPVQEEKPIGSDEITEEKLLIVWAKMAESEKSSPKLYTTVSQTTPILRGNTVIFSVKNELQKNWIEQQRKQKFLAFLKEGLNNNDIDLEIVVVENGGDVEEKLYMPQEKAKFLLENYPEAKELRDDLKLELK